MLNIIIFLAISIVGSTIIVFSLRLGKEAAFVAVAINLILVSAVGSELISLVGAVTNAGNVFYALVLFSICIISEFYGKKAAHRAVWIGFIAVIVFVLMTQFTIRLDDSPFNQTSNGAMEIVFNKVPRISFASLFAYLASTYFFIWVYGFFRQKATSFNSVGIRYLASVFATQIIDSVLFFSIAFLGLMPASVLFEIMAVGFVSKFAVGLISIPFLYLSRRFIVQAPE